MGKALFNKFLYYVGLSDNKIGVDNQEFNKTKNPNNSKIIDINSKKSLNDSKIIILKPNSYEEAILITKKLKERKPVILNITEVDYDIGKRILDFLSGSIYALNGDMCKVEKGIFLITPEKYYIEGKTDNNMHSFYSDKN